jgi:hypothetical protein
MVLEAVNREMGLSNETLEIKKGFSVLYLQIN